MTKLLLLKVITVVSVSMLTFAVNSLNAQNYTGIWQGYITASDGGVQFYNSGYTLNIKSHMGDVITGNSYIYGRNPLTFDGFLDFIGTVNTKQNKSWLTELKILQYTISNDTVKLCIKLADMNFTNKNGIDYLTGNWNGTIESGLSCAPGKVYLQRYNPEKPNGIEPIPGEIMKMINNDKSSKMKFLGTELMEPVIINVSSNHIQFKLEDYMKEDMDTVSVYFNRAPLLSKVRIAKKPKSFAVRLDKRSELTEIIMYAENLGKIPPNTSNLTIIDGEKKHKILIQSTKEKSAVIYLRYTDKTPVTPPKGISQRNIVNKQ